MAKIKVPYTMHCPSCKVGIKIKNEAMIGTTIKCPKCKKSIEVVTPEEDGYIPYSVEPPPEPEPEPEPTEEELEQKEEEERKARRKKQIQQAKYIASILWLLLLLGAIAGLVWYFVDLNELGKDKEEKGPARLLTHPDVHYVGRTGAGWPLNRA